MRQLLVLQESLFLKNALLKQEFQLSRELREPLNMAHLEETQDLDLQCLAELMESQELMIKLECQLPLQLFNE